MAVVVPGTIAIMDVPVPVFDPEVDDGPEQQPRPNWVRVRMARVGMPFARWAGLRLNPVIAGRLHDSNRSSPDQGHFGDGLAFCAINDASLNAGHRDEGSGRKIPVVPSRTQHDFAPSVRLPGNDVNPYTALIGCHRFHGGEKSGRCLRRSICCTREQH